MTARLADGPGYRWDWSIIFTEPYLEWLYTGLQLTLVMGVVGFGLALLIGVPLGVARTSGSRVISGLAKAYVDVFRNIPLLVQMFLWFYVVPELLPSAMGNWLKRGLPEPELMTAIVCLGTAAAARVCEHVRAAINTVPTGLVAAGRASGLGKFQINRYIVLPLATRRVIPTLISEFLAVFKNSSLAMTIGVLEITAQSRRILDYTFHGFEAFTAATVLYAVICVSTLLLVLPLEKRLRVHGLVESRA